MRAGKVTLAGVALAGVIGLFVGLSGYAFVYAEGGSYLSNDPSACVNCHVMRDQFDAWQKSPHHASATCNDCHVPHDTAGKYLTKVRHGYSHSKGFTLQDFDEPIRITPGDMAIVNNNCVRCHEELVSEITKPMVQGHPGYAKDPGSGVGENGANCTSCHGGIGHGPRR